MNALDRHSRFALTTPRWFVCAAAAAALLPSGATAAPSWSTPVAVAHGATIIATAGDRDGVVVAVLGPQAGTKDFSGISGPVGLEAVVADAGGAGSAVVPLTNSPTAHWPSVAVGSNHPVVAWADCPSAGHCAVWVWDSWLSGPQIVELASNGSGPAVATDEHGDAVVTWGDQASGQLVAASSVGGASFTAPVPVSPGATYGTPLATMDSHETATIGWETTFVHPYNPNGATTQVPLVMTATLVRGGQPGAAETALSGPVGSMLGAATLQSDSYGRVLASATITPPPTPSPPFGGPTTTFALANAAGAFSPQAQLASSPDSIYGTSWATGSGGDLLGAAATNTPSVSQLTTTRLSPSGNLTTQNPFTAPMSASTFPPAVSTAVPGFDSGNDAFVVFTTFDERVASGFGNPTAGSILSVVAPSDGAGWCPAQVISGLMSPLFPIGVAFDGAGHGIVVYQQNPYGTIGASYLTPHDGCPTVTAAPPVTLAQVAQADRKLRTATIAASCTTAAACAGTVVLLDARSRTLASGKVTRSHQLSAPIRVLLTKLGRSNLHRHRRVPARAVLRTGKGTLALRRLTLTRS